MIEVIDITHVLGRKFVEKPTQTFLPVVVLDLVSDILQGRHNPYEKA